MNADVNEETKVVSKERNHFTIIPNIVFHLKLKHTEFRLYCWYRKVCGESDNTCWASLKRISKECRMDHHTVISAREKLQKLDLIKVEKIDHKDGSTRVIVTLESIWEENYDLFKHKHGTGKQPIGIQTDRTGKQPSGGRENNPTNNNPIKKKITVALPAPRASGNGVGFHFDNNDKKVIEKKPPRIFAEKLYKALSEKRKITRHPKLGQWAEQIRKFFIESDTLTSEEFNSVLDWYIKHIGEEFVQVALCAKSFCDKFDNIKESMIKDNKRLGISYNEPSAEPIKERIVDYEMPDDPNEYADYLDNLDN